MSNLHAIPPYYATNVLQLKKMQGSSMLATTILRCLLFIVIAAHILASAPISARACTAPDKLSRVTGNAECFAIRTEPSAAVRTPPLLVTWIHGDVGTG